MAVTAINLRKDYTDPSGHVATILDVAHFHIADADHVALVGGSGTGKTTLLHCLAGIVAPTDGEVRFHTDHEPPEQGVDIAGLSEPRRDAFRGKYLGYVFQTHHLLPGFTALENVLLGMSFTGKTADRDHARHLLEEVGMADRLHYKPGKLSVGQQQRVAVARALASKPALVLADEPTGALDPATAQSVLDLIRRLCTEAGSALVVVTHDRDLAGQLPTVVDLADINRVASLQEAAS
ncbi:MAG: ABC transporter ATP-binding protein [Planctomycetota bacterium]